MQPYYQPGNRLYPSASVVVCYRAKTRYLFVPFRGIVSCSVPFRELVTTVDVEIETCSKNSSIRIYRPFIGLHGDKEHAHTTVSHIWCYIQ